MFGFFLSHAECKVIQYLVDCSILLRSVGVRIWPSAVVSPWDVDFQSHLQPGRPKKKGVKTRAATTGIAGMAGVSTDAALPL